MDVIVFIPWVKIQNLWRQNRYIALELLLEKYETLILNTTDKMNIVIYILIYQGVQMSYQLDNKNAIYRLLH